MDDERAEERFEMLAASFAGEPDVSEGTGFGTIPGLRTGGKIFAMLARGRLVVKLPRERVDALVAAGGAERFDPGHGRRMKEWASLEPDSDQDWTELAAKARQFVITQSAAPRYTLSSCRGDRCRDEEP